MSDDDFFKRFFFRGNAGFQFPSVNQPPGDNYHDEFNNNINSSLFHDMNRMFEEMDQMMKQFTFGFGGFGHFGHSLPNRFDIGQGTVQS
jgi:hypothetical protein